MIRDLKYVSSAQFFHSFLLFNPNLKALNRNIGLTAAKKQPKYEMK
jgi:hypothetical protein